jgi:hypothetical protein
MRAFLLAALIGGSSLAAQTPAAPTPARGSQVQTWDGQLVDAVKTNCSVEVSAAYRGVVCPVSMQSTSMGLMLADGKFVKFDEGGNAKATEALKKSRKGSKTVAEYWRTGKTSSQIKARVTGTLTSDTLNVDSIRIE